MENQTTDEVEVIALATLLRAFHDGEIIVQLEYVEIDHTPVDVVVVIPIDHLGTKLKPTYLIGRVTRYVVGFSIEIREK